MDLLSKSLPESVIIGGRDYKINTDFRIGIQAEDILVDTDMPVERKVMAVIKLYFDELPPFECADEIVHSIFWFYTGREYEEQKKQLGKRPERRYYSFIHDSGLIYAAFLQQYGIDLTACEHMHWWKFRSMFNGLSEDTEFMKVVKYRAIQITPKMTKEQKEFYRTMKKAHALPVPTVEQKKQDFIADVLMNGGDLSGITERYYEKD